jgi:hypothetical protein
VHGSPPADDVLRARLKTVGVSEHTFEMESTAGREAGTEWRIVDVGGSRSQVRPVPPCRHACSIAPAARSVSGGPRAGMCALMFAGLQRSGCRSSTTVRAAPRSCACVLTPALVDAIIFMAPISGFDQVLVEDRTVNRLVRAPPAPPRPAH